MNYLENPINKTDTLFISKNVLFKSNALYAEGEATFCFCGIKGTFSGLVSRSQTLYQSLCGKRVW